MNRLTAPILLAFILASVLPAQEGDEAAVRENPAATITYAEGGSFLLIRDGRSVSYEAASQDVIGLALDEDDAIHTGEGTFLEIRLNRGGALVKLASDTSFTIDALDEGGGGVLRLAYGRILSKVTYLAGGSQFWVRGGDTVAGVRGTEFGYDLSIDPAQPDAGRLTTVYCFDGEVELYRSDPAVLSKLDLLNQVPVVLGAGRMIRLTPDDPADARLRTSEMDESLAAYWALHPFITLIGADPAAGDVLVVSDSLNLEEAALSLKEEYELGGKITFGTGVVMMTLGGFLRAFLPGNQTVADLSTGLLVVGGGATVGGGVMMLMSRGFQ